MILFIKMRDADAGGCERAKGWRGHGISCGCIYITGYRSCRTAGEIRIWGGAGALRSLQPSSAQQPRQRWSRVCVCPLQQTLKATVNRFTEPYFCSTILVVVPYTPSLKNFLIMTRDKESLFAFCVSFFTAVAHSRVPCRRCPALARFCMYACIYIARGARWRIKMRRPNPRSRVCQPND